MKKIVLAVALVFMAGSFAFAQSPVSWSFSSKKVNSTTYEVHMTATIQNGWHLYAQAQPKEAIAMPTTFTFSKNPLVTLNGGIKEVGKLEKFKDKDLGIEANQYSKKVDFVQLVKLKGNLKTNLAGSVEYQTCDDHKCLPPKTIPFNIALK